jgi:predicted membrane channel-forming protein YqfA (hemolysin III family)
MDKKPQQRSTAFSQTIVVFCLAAILTPIGILFAVDIPESLRTDWQPWAMGLYAAGVLRMLSISTKF